MLIRVMADPKPILGRLALSGNTGRNIGCDADQ